MEELTPEWTNSFVQTEGVSINHYINAKIPEVLRSIMVAAPPKFLTVIEDESLPIPIKKQDGSGRIELPDTVLRPVMLRMEGWRKPVTHFIDETHPLYELQFNRYTRGGVGKPVAVWHTDGQGHQVIDYFSLPASYKEHKVEQFTYIPHVDDNAQQYLLHPLIIDVLCYRCAATVYDIMGNRAMAEIMMSHANM